MAKISVVMPTWNRARMVTQAVRAALTQTRPPDEVVVSDDCSTDDTYSILCTIASHEPRLRVIRQESNSGGVPNWNKVVDASLGDYIVWCSDDDRFLPDHIEASVGFLEKNPEIDMVHSGFLNVNEGATDNGDSYIPDIKTAEKSALRSAKPTSIAGFEVFTYVLRYYNWPFHPSTLVFRRTLWARVGPFDAKYGLSDTDWFVRAAMKGTIAYLPRYSVINRRHTGNWSNRIGSLKMQQEVHDVIVKALRSMQGKVSPLKIALFRWIWDNHYQYILLRIFVARSRAGIFDVALEVAREMLGHSIVIKHVLPEVLTNFTIRVVSYILYMIQGLLPGGREKYANLGKFVPK